MMLMPSIFGENLFDDFFDDFYRPARKNVQRGVPATAVMKTDILEQADCYELDIDLPGYKKEDVKAELKEGYLTIQASSHTEKDEKDEKGRYLRRERYTGHYQRTFYVGEDVTESDIKAGFQDGVLNITVPKKEALPQAEEEKEKYITIE